MLTFGTLLVAIWRRMRRKGRWEAVDIVLNIRATPPPPLLPQIPLGDACQQPGKWVAKLPSQSPEMVYTSPKCMV